MDYTHLFNTQDEKNTVYNSDEYKKPWVSYVKDSNKVEYSKKPVKLIFTATQDTTVPVYYTKQSYIDGTPDLTISLTANTLKTTTIPRNEIYRFGIVDYNTNTLERTNVNDVFTAIEVDGCVIDGYRLFDNCTTLTSCTVSNLDTSKMTDTRHMFENCYTLTKLDTSFFDTSNITNMNSMFYGCSSLTDLDVSFWDTSKVTDMGSLFRSCGNLSKLDVHAWNTKNVTDMSYLFYACSSLERLNVSLWNTTKVTNMAYMFRKCSKITNLDVFGFYTNIVTNMSNMFCACSLLTKLDTTYFNISNVTDTSEMFAACTSLTTIGDVDTSLGWKHEPGTHTDMFKNCSATPKPSWA